MKKLFAALTLIAVLLCWGCGTSGGGAEAYYSFTDAAGRTVTLDARPQRVVSLMGSYAETWLLAGGTLAGVTSDVIDEGRLDALPEGTHSVGSVKTPDVERVLSLDPDFVLLSADIAGHAAAAATLGAARIPYAFFKVEQFSDYLAMLKICTDLTGRADLYAQNGTDIEGSIQATIDSVKGLPAPRVLFLRVYSSGAKAKADDNVTSHILRDFGCVNIAELKPSLLTDLSVEVIIKEDPDVILATSMGDEKKAQATLDALLASDSWKGLTAVKEGACHMLRKDLFHYKPNARWGEAYEALKTILFE